jgi:hypothetical protein
MILKVSRCQCTCCDHGSRIARTRLSIYLFEATRLGTGRMKVFPCAGLALFGIRRTSETWVVVRSGLLSSPVSRARTLRPDVNTVPVLGLPHYHYCCHFSVYNTLLRFVHAINSQPCFSRTKNHTRIQVVAIYPVMPHHDCWLIIQT